MIDKFNINLWILQETIKWSLALSNVMKSSEGEGVSKQPFYVQLK